MTRRTLRYKTTVFERVVIMALILLCAAQFSITIAYHNGYNHFTDVVHQMCVRRYAYDLAQHVATGKQVTFYADEVAYYNKILPGLHGESHQLAIVLRDDAFDTQRTLQRAYDVGVINACGRLS